jgi:hypothetical protein
LDLNVFHILEDEVHQAIPDDVWDEQIGVMGDVLDGPGLAAAVSAMRAQAAEGN